MKTQEPFKLIDIAVLLTSFLRIWRNFKVNLRDCDRCMEPFYNLSTQVPCIAHRHTKLDALLLNSESKKTNFTNFIRQKFHYKKKVGHACNSLQELWCSNVVMKLFLPFDSVIKQYVSYRFPGWISLLLRPQCSQLKDIIMTSL